MREGRGLGLKSVRLGARTSDFGEKSVGNRNEIWVGWKWGHGCTQMYNTPSFFLLENMELHC